jgi:hypothetical protein
MKQDQHWKIVIERRVNDIQTELPYVFTEK